MKDYDGFVKRAKKIVPKDKVLTGELLRLAWGTDAGFYRLIPKAVAMPENEEQMSRLLALASEMGIPATFRAAGTSLSGQSITDSVLIVAGKGWEKYTIGKDAETITLQPGIIGNRVNELLAPYGKLFTPDPASKASAMVGGIVINNASGMNCGTHANSDKMMLSMRIVLSDGTVVDTAKPGDSEREKKLLKDIATIRDEIRGDKELAERIEKKYRIKNVTGLNLRPFVAYDNPREILAHLMVGSEGTLGFMSECTMLTAPLLPLTASCMAYFSEITEACRAVVRLKKDAPEVYSCELLDKKSLASVHDETGEGLTALLIETRAQTENELKENTKKIEGILSEFNLYKPAEFTADPTKTGAMWKMRSGIFPTVGGTRPPGTTSLIEDIAFPIDHLPQATADMARLIEEAGYDDACIYGHAFEGNYHFIIAQAFNDDADIAKYQGLIEAVVDLVVDKYDGSLKAEHGTGRNMAPFVEKEWGAKAFEMMRKVKAAFDPEGLLNPGVIFNDDPQCYLKNLKPLPLTDPLVDKCIECGFCEVNCISCGLTMSARERIVARREISSLRESGENPERLATLEKEYKYLGDETCAADGLCSTSCPMGINTADLTHKIREQQKKPGSIDEKIGRYAADHLSGVEGNMRGMLWLASVGHKALGDKGVDALGKVFHKAGLPLWTSSLPEPRKEYKPARTDAEKYPNGKIVYFPSCINQTMGLSVKDGKKPKVPLIETMVELCHRAGFEVVFPERMRDLCCGMIWESKGMPKIADEKTAELETALLEASKKGRYPVLCDQSPCLHRMRQHIKSLKLYEPAEFIADILAPHLKFTQIDETVAVHITCSTRLMGLNDKLIGLAMKCAKKVVVPAEVGCCGFAGDKGFMHPELNAWGLRKLRPQIEAAGARRGYSNSRTCEIGLTTHSGVPYESIAYLVEEATRPGNA
ncbi:MAG: FAD-binding oxidoreductase [Clostridium sp.]|nr:FAD-binding oxidoreductase [Clostridium sp.]